ncbi:MAG: FMN-binding protein [Eubacteriales bacterium]|nr:FMN-binding protein [Eubacteriales bacterium]
MKNKNVRGILALALVTALSFGVIAGSKALSKNENTTASTTEEKVLEELDVSGAENIEKAVKTENGYVVTVKKKGYGGDIVMNVSFDADGKKVTKVEVTEQSETPNVGSRITEPEFLSQFEGVEAPVYLPGMSLGGEEESSADELEGAELQDGTYEAKADSADSSGFTDQMTMTVKDGKITEVVWEAVGEDGKKKSVMSEEGEYVMTEDGLTWKEQAEALAAAVIENQNLSFLNMDEQGKTDAVNGVSISVGGFASLAEECMKEAAGLTEKLELKDGTYEAKTEGPDSSGFTDQVNITVKDGKITEVVWEAVGEDGKKKSVMSEEGEYVMTEDGPTWKEQAEALAAALVEHQNLEFLTMDEQGKTDAVAGVSVSVNGFVKLAQQCLDESAGVEREEAPAPQNGTQVDAVSGATVSSTAAVTGINEAYEFLNSAK